MKIYIFNAITLISFFSFHSCSNSLEEQTVPIKFIEKSAPPFPPLLVGRPFADDTTFKIQLIDSNRDGDYFDYNQNSCDFITVNNIKYAQFAGIVFQTKAQINYVNDFYTFEVDTISKSAVLRREKKRFSNPDINIFNSVPNIKLYTQNDTSIQTDLKALVDAIDTKFVFISFWATSCHGCIKELEFYSNYKKEINDANLTVISISSIEELKNSLIFINKHDYKNVFYNCDTDDMNILNCKGYPNGILLDSNFVYIRHFSYSPINDILNYMKQNI